MLLDEAFQSFGAAAENDLAPSVESIFPLGWSSKGLPVDLRLYNEFDFILIRSLR